MIGYGLGLVMAVVMFMAMRKGADSPSPILAAIRVKKHR
jgi:hypothetical protein